MNFEDDYSVEKLQARLLELYPRFRAKIDTKDLLKQIKVVSESFPTVKLYNGENETPFSFIQAAVEFKDRCFFLEFPPGLDDGGIPGRDPRRPYLILESKEIPASIKEGIKSIDDYKNLLKDFCLKENFGRGIAYRKEDVYLNIEEIRKLEAEAMRAMTRDLSSDEFKKELQEPNTVSMIFLYGSQDDLEDRIFELLVRFSDPIKYAIMKKSILAEHFDSETDEAVREILNRTVPSFLFVPFGDEERKKDKSIIFDSFNSSQIIGSVANHWTNPNGFKGFEKEEEYDSTIMRTLDENKTFVQLFVDKHGTVPFQYILAATNPMFYNHINFGYQINPSEKVKNTFKIGKQLPMIVALSYAQDNYLSKETFATRHFVEESHSNYTNYPALHHFLYNVSTHNNILRTMFARELSDLTVNNIEDLDIEDNMKEIFFITLNV